MRDFWLRHPNTKWSLLTVGALLLVLALVISFFDWNRARGPIARLITAKTGRPAAIDGNLRVHLWSWEPNVDIEGLHIGNPDWAKQPVMFGAQTISVSVSLGRLLRGQIVLPKVQVLSPQVNLERDKMGRASWEFDTPAGAPAAKNGKPTQLPTVRSLLIRDGKLNVEDQEKKLSLHGLLNAGEQGSNQESAFQLRLSGSLNAKPLTVAFNGGPLLNLNPHTPYDFDLKIEASTIHVSAVVTIVHPFDLSEFTAKLHVSGEDLADAYYLTGLALPNTAHYDIAGDVHRTNALFQIDGLKGQIGSSDIEGTLGVDTGQKRLALKATLTSKNLNFKDLAPTLGAAPAPASVKSHTHPTTAPEATRPKASKEDLLLPDADLQINRIRAMDADVTYHARSVTAPKLPMKEVNFHIVLDNGDLKINPLAFVLEQGIIAGAVDINARHEVPETTIDMHVDHVDLSQFKSAKATTPPISGTLHGRLRIHGLGGSVHKLASTADGGLGIAIPHGEVSDVLAELTGINVLKGLGLLFNADNKKAEIRCGVVDFEAVKGQMTAKTLFVDTTNVLITGRGTIQLGSEAMDLSMQGDPKHLRLVRLRAPVSVTGTLADPTIGVKPEKLALQVGAAVALGVLLTPVAAALAFVDPGLAKDENCVAMLNDAQEATAGAPAPAVIIKKKKP